MNTTRKTWIYAGLITAFALGCALQNATAQPLRGGDEERPRERIRERRGDLHDEASHMERWLQRLEQQDPEEYERLTALRESHPMAFRLELRRRVHEARMLQRIREEQPGFHAYLSGLDREERDQLGHFLRDIADESAPPSRMGRHRRLRQPAVEAHEDVRELVDAWRAAEVDTERDSVKNALREHIAGIFDERTELQKEEMERVEEQLHRLRQLLAAREANREEWIDRIINQLLSP